MMDQRKLLLLSLCFLLDSEETIVGDAGLTPLCSNAKLNAVILIVCKIKTRNVSEGCRLLYHYEKGFKDECDSGFTLKTVNQTVFLQLTPLTRDDGGNYTCECSHRHGTDTVRFQWTADDASDPLHSNLSLTTVSSTAAVSITLTGALLGFLLRKKHRRCCSRSRELEVSVIEERQDDLYAALQQPADDLYQTAPSGCYQSVDTWTITSESKAPGAPSAGRGQTDEIYENMQTEI